MRLAVGDGTYEIHGTNNPTAVGMAVTHGCIRMYPEDVAALFKSVPIGTKVWLLNKPVKVTYVGGELLLEAHPPVDKQGQSVEPDLKLLSKELDRVLGSSTVAIRWDYARQTLRAASGIPTLVGLEANVDAIRAPAATQAAKVASPSATTGGSAPAITPAHAAIEAPNGG
jgi:L,D-transpeptidase ErfK/SrfK